MILESARVENFKCIDDSTEFSIRSLTALVGKNESGKTALLKALYRINPILPVAPIGCNLLNSADALLGPDVPVAGSSTVTLPAPVCAPGTSRR